MPVPHPMDRSVAFTALLEYPDFAGLPSRDGSNVITNLLHDWETYSTSPDMFTFVATWWSEHRAEYAPQAPEASVEAPEPTSLSQAVDQAVEAANAAFLADPAAQAQAEEDGERWRHIFEAEQAAGKHGVVLPTALAYDLLTLLAGGETRLPKSLLVASLEQRIVQAGQR